MRVAVDAFRKIAAAGAPFVTRGDKSGTHVKEMEVWKASGVEPTGAWYETFAEGSKGNKVTTRHADSRKAYVLMDRATYLTLKKEIGLVPLVEGDKLLMNYIAVIAVNPERFPNVNAKGATAFMDWLTGDEAQALIRDFGKDTFGEPLFFPNAKH
jgi:tungstate transport system substrate-binding protein